MISLRTLFALVVLVFLSTGIATAGKNNKTGPVCLVLLSDSGLQQWTAGSSSPTLRTLYATGSIAAMNDRTARSPREELSPSPQGAALTLTAGARCLAPDSGIELFRSRARAPFGDATCAQILQRRTGVIAPPDSLVDIDWPLLIYDNSRLGYRTDPGNLVSSLRAHGIETFASGGPDAYIAGLGDGYVRRGSPIAPGTDLVTQGLWIVDLGNGPGSVESRLGRIAKRIQSENGLLIVASLYPTQRDYEQGRRLTPVVFAGADGLLLSPSTHTAGLIVLPDLAPTIANHFNVVLNGPAYGQPLQGKLSSDQIAAVNQIVQRADTQRTAMALLPAAAVLLGLLMGAVALCVRLCPDRRNLVLPLPLLLLWLVFAPTVPIAFAGALVTLYPVVEIGRRLGIGRTLFVLSALPLVAVLLDPLAGNPLMHRSLLGYSQIEGARFYGIGNEAMGIVVGSAMVITLLVSRRSAQKSQTVLLALFVAVAALLGLPEAGAKVGGVLVGTGTFGTYLMLLRNRKFGARQVVAVTLVTVVALGLVLVADRHMAEGQQTHLARLTDQLGGGSAEDLFDTALRKAAIELRLLFHSCWAVAVFGGLAAFVATRKNDGTMANRAYGVASVTAVVLTLLLNDAGVVACALMLPYLTAGNLIEG